MTKVNDKTPPVSCTLNDAEFREREKIVLEKFRQTVLATRELSDGYAYLIPNTDTALRETAELILLERKCCPFLDFKVIVEAGDGDIWFELTGAAGAKEFIAATFSSES